MVLKLQQCFSIHKGTYLCNEIDGLLYSLMLQYEILEKLVTFINQRTFNVQGSLKCKTLGMWYSSRADDAGRGIRPSTDTSPYRHRDAGYDQPS